MFWKKKKGRGRDAGGESTGESREPDAVVWKSNAPDGWPLMNVPPLGGDNDALITLVFSGEFARAMKALPDCGLKIETFAARVLTSRGVVHIPLLIRARDRAYGVFPLRGNTFDERARFWSARAALAERGYEAVYYCPEALDEMPPVEELPTLAFSDFASADEADLPDGRWAMWWNNPETEGQLDRFFAHLARIYELSEGVYSYLLGSLAHALRDDDEPLSRVGLPEEVMMIPTTAPEGQPCLVTVCAQKGLRFHFPEAKQDVEYLLLFLENYAALVESVRGAVEEMGLPMDDASEASPRAWCRGVMAALRQQMEAGHRLGVIGMVE